MHSPLHDSDDRTKQDSEIESYLAEVIDADLKDIDYENPFQLCPYSISTLLTSLKNLSPTDICEVIEYLIELRQFKEVSSVDRQNLASQLNCDYPLVPVVELTSSAIELEHFINTE